MDSLTSILLGDNTITFSISFLLNIALILGIWFHYMPLEKERDSLKESNAEKDKVISEQAAELKELVEKVLPLIENVNSKVSGLSNGLQDTVREVTKELEKIQRVYDKLDDTSRADKDLAGLLRTLQSSVDNLNNKQTILQGVLIGQSLFDDSVTRVK